MNPNASLSDSVPRSFFASVAALQARWNVLEHPFYVRWTAGELLLADLALYAGQYEHAVNALAAAARHAADAAPRRLRAALAQHADEEAAHVELWRAFRRAVAGDAAVPLPATVYCAKAWAGSTARGFAETLSALYAIESAQPAVAQSRLDGLQRAYGIRDENATAYFHLHATRDVEHAKELQEQLACLESWVAPAGLLHEAERVLQANWWLLSGVRAAMQQR